MATGFITNFSSYLFMVFLPRAMWNLTVSDHKLVTVEKVYGIMPLLEDRLSSVYTLPGHATYGLRKPCLWSSSTGKIAKAYNIGLPANLDSGKHHIV